MTEDREQANEALHYDTLCECGHEKDDHLTRLDITGTVYGRCNVTDQWDHPCLCGEYEGAQ